MAMNKLYLRGGAICSNLLKCICLKLAIDAHFVNFTAYDQATDLLPLGLNDVTHKGRMYKAVFFLASWTGKTLYVYEHYMTVLTEGSLSEFFIVLIPIHPPPMVCKAAPEIPVIQQRVKEMKKLMKFYST